jgi:hypothetical protein
MDLILSILLLLVPEGVDREVVVVVVVAPVD